MDAPLSRPTETAREAASAVLEALERVLADEALALRTLDRDKIEQAAQRKSDLCDGIEAVRSALSPEHQNAIERIRKLALHNHILLFHARDCVRQVLGTASGQAASPSFGGLRLDVRG